MESKDERVKRSGEMRGRGRDEEEKGGGGWEKERWSRFGGDEMK